MRDTPTRIGAEMETTMRVGRIVNKNSVSTCKAGSAWKHANGKDGQMRERISDACDSLRLVIVIITRTTNT